MGFAMNIIRKYLVVFTARRCSFHERVRAACGSQESIMKKNLLYLLFASVSFPALNVPAEIILFDYADSPVSVSITANDGELQTDSVFFSLDGASSTSGDLEISLSAAVDKSSKTYWSTISLENGFAEAAANDFVNVTTVFTDTTTELIGVTAKNKTGTYADYVALRFTNTNGEDLYGWAEIAANTRVKANGKQSSANISILRMAYNNEAGASIIVGDTFGTEAIPEPAAATLVVGAGGSLLGIRRFFGS